LDWLNPTLVLAGLAVDDPHELVDAVARTMATARGLDAERVRTALTEAMKLEGWSLGGGVGVPHAELEGLTEPAVCLVVTSAPVDLPSIDARKPDIFLFIVAPADDPEGHLLLLARLARLAQSRTLLEALRKAPSSDDVVALVRAAERRHQPGAPGAMSSGSVLIVIAIAGEKAVDALLVELVDRGLDEATIVEAQSLREATTREVPLFAGFHDIFGDPGGRRVILLDAPASESVAIMDAVRRIATEHGARQVSISVVALESHWHYAHHPDEEGAGRA
jgi:mannitol/fructose-specific phosphotransferase system IIA component (Ntr-type)